MAGENGTWIALVDGRKARLLRAASTPQGRLRLDQQAAIEERWDEHEVTKPNRVAIGGGAAHVMQGDFAHRDVERTERFAREVSAFLGRELEQRKIAHLELFAAPRMLGAVRKELSKTLAPRIAQHEADLAHLSEGELAKHPAIVRACGG
jgi:protein required for attachment to host cells